jgi:citrate synthase
MAYLPDTQTTSIATSTTEDVIVRDKRLCDDLIGKLTFTEMIFFQMLGRTPTPAEAAVVDACLVSLMEHGLTPSALATRLTYTSAPEAMQAAVAAGLLGVGSLFVGTMDGCARLLQRLVEVDEQLLADEARRIAQEHRESRSPLPGFGHPIHRPDDPRALLLLELAREHGIAGRHVAAIEELSAAVDAVYERHITINVTGAIAAALADCGVPYEIMRGFALITRCAGLVGHVHEEQHKPTLRVVWETSEHAIPYDGAFDPDT